MPYFAALTGLLVGSGYGYISQRGAFCMSIALNREEGLP
jgi:hypothetical protein